MPTQSTTYNSRVTDEALEKRFRDTFRSQGGAELVDDLYAQGVIVPVVDFTAAATGDTLGTNLQTAWDFTTGHNTIAGATATLISTAGFWKVDLTLEASATNQFAAIRMSDGLTSKDIWRYDSGNIGVGSTAGVDSDKFVVFLKAGDTLSGVSGDSDMKLNVSYRQIATVNGDLVKPSGFTSS